MHKHENRQQQKKKPLQTKQHSSRRHKTHSAAQHNSVCAHRLGNVKEVSERRRSRTVCKKSASQIHASSFSTEPKNTQLASCAACRSTWVVLAACLVLGFAYSSTSTPSWCHVLHCRPLARYGKNKAVPRNNSVCFILGASWRWEVRQMTLPVQAAGQCFQL